MKSIILKSAAAVATGTLLPLTVPLSASAHVAIDPQSAEAGSYTVIAVKVPNESATATTTKVELTLPQETPFSSVRYVPVAGWTVELVREALAEPVMVGQLEITEAVTKVIWTADAGSGIGDRQLQQFPLSLGPVPDVGSIPFTADQFYSDGEIVSWNEHGDGGESEPAVPQEAGSASADSAIPLGLGIGALVLALAAFMLALAAHRKAGSR